MIKHQIKEGIVKSFKHVTNNSDAFPYTSTELDFLLSSPAVVTLIIKYSSELLDSLLPHECITVGKSIELFHENPTLIGEEISITISITKLFENDITLEFKGNDKSGGIFRGSCVRAITHRSYLLKHAYDRAGVHI